MRRRIVQFALATLLLTGGCAERAQSALHPAGPAAEEIARLWWIMFAVLTAAFIAVMVMVVLAVFRHTRSEQPPAPLGNRFIVITGIVLPAIILVVLMIYSLQTTLAIRAPETNLTIEVIGHQWWWEVRYPEHEIVTANEIHIPVGEPVRLELSSGDVVHSFWVPNLHGKMDMLPDHPNTFWIQADEAGVYRGQCAEFCGLQHARMAIEVVALSRESFDAWLGERWQPHPPPATPALQRGQSAFFARGCNACHTIRGTEAHGTEAPDLTHIGSRRTLGAGLLPNTRGNLSGWIVNAPALKPGIEMPRAYPEPRELRELVEYLESLD